MELIADKLAWNLPNFKLHKTTKLPNEWSVSKGSTILIILGHMQKFGDYFKLHLVMLDARSQAVRCTDFHLESLQYKVTIEKCLCFSL